MWDLVAKSRGKATFARGKKKIVLSYTNDRATGEHFTVVREGDAWRCDCPVEIGCLHATLAVRALTESAGGAPSDAPDPRFARGFVLSPGLSAAAARSKLPVSRDDDAVRVGDATVTVDGTCDCPMGDAPVCLHRAIADLWARGGRVAASASAPAVTAVVERQGEKLPDEDVARFAPLLDKADAIAAELLTFGLQRSSRALIDRLDALVIAAQTAGVRDRAPRDAGLGRLVRALESLRATLSAFQQREVTTTENDVLGALAVVRNLGRAIRANTGKLPLTDFAGATQQEYDVTPVLDVQGLGLEAWRGSDYAGVTAYVVDLRTGRVLTRTNALPVEQLPGNWTDSLAAAAAFAGASVSYTKLARGRFLLSGAQVSELGRLSGSAKTQLAEREALKLDDARLRAAILAGAGDAARFARRLAYDPLGRPPPSPPVALVEVESIDPPVFDRQTQELAFGMRTTGGLALVARATYSPAIETYVDNLEKLAKLPRPPRALLCKLSLGGGLTALPITAHLEGGKPQHLTYARLDA